MHAPHRRQSIRPGAARSPSERDTAHLVTASQQGDQEAFALLVRRYQRRIFNLSLDLLRDEKEASACTQETFVAAWQELPWFRDGTRFATWLYRLAYQWSVRQLEQRTREPIEHSAGEAEPVLKGNHPEKQGAETARGQNPQALVREQLEHLPLQERTVLILHHLHHQTYEEMASILIVSSGTVKTRLFRARTHLAQRLAGTAALLPQETMAGTPFTENEASMDSSESFSAQGREPDSIPDHQETDDFAQSQHIWREQQLDWLEQQQNAVAQQEAWLHQRRGWLQQQQGWLEQRRLWVAEQRGWLSQRRGWLSSQGDRLTQQEAWLMQQEAWLDQQHTALVQQVSEVMLLHHWVQQRRGWLDRQHHRLTQQDGALDSEEDAG